MFIVALFTIARTWKQPRYPLAGEWIRKLWYIYTMKYYSAIKKNAFESVLMRWMKLESIIQSEVSQKEKHQCSILTLPESQGWFWFVSPAWFGCSLLCHRFSQLLITAPALVMAMPGTSQWGGTCPQISYLCSVSQCCFGWLEDALSHHGEKRMGMPLSVSEASFPLTELS